MEGLSSTADCRQWAKNLSSSRRGAMLQNNSAGILMYVQGSSRLLSGDTSSRGTRVVGPACMNSLTVEAIALVASCPPSSPFSSESAKTIRASHGMRASLRPDSGRAQGSVGSFSTIWGNVPDHAPTLPGGGYRPAIRSGSSPNCGALTTNS